MSSEPVLPVPPAEAAKRPNLLRRIYDWVLGWAQTPYGVPALFLLAVFEASFFPIPPDVLLIALALSVPARAFRFALWCTIGSVLGGVLGYCIGYWAWSTFEPLLINRLFTAENFEAVTSKYRQYGGLAVFTAALTPIPYKVFTVAAGVSAVDIYQFIGASVAGRGMRFFLVAAVIRATGTRARALIDRYFNLMTIVGAVLLVGGLLLIKAL